MNEAGAETGGGSSLVVWDRYTSIVELFVSHRIIICPVAETKQSRAEQVASFSRLAMGG